MWHIWIDTGGTFTDCVAIDPLGKVHRAKVLSHSALRGRVIERTGACSVRSDLGAILDFDLVTGLEVRALGDERSVARVERYEPHSGEIVLESALPAALVAGAPFEITSTEPASILAARLVTRTPQGRPLPPARLRFATTRGTNALLERRGAPVALFMTRGFGDLLAIGDQQRPDLFALAVRKPPPLYATVVEVPERVAADGTILEPLDLDSIEAEIEHVHSRGIECAAVALLHAWVNPVHEERLATHLRERGFGFVSAAAALAPLIRLLPRAETAVVDAYLGPVVAGHLDDLCRGAASGSTGDNVRVHVMTSAGGLVARSGYHARDSLLSGPAAGLVGAVRAAQRAGHARVITFDMGGTSTDVARFAGDFEYRFEHRVAGVRLLRPALAIETVAAGGGSICHFSGGRIQVGPQSAAAAPGPACYGAGGPLTLTDVNLLLGRLDASRFEIPIEPQAAERAIDRMRVEIETQMRAAPPRDELLEGLLDIANELMAGAIARVSVGRGYDPAEHVLVAFGGAGGQHACAIAERLGIDRISMPADASLLSAAGLGGAAVERFAEEQVLRPLASLGARELDSRFALLERAALDAVERDEPGARAAVRRRIASVRAVGQDATLDIEVVPGRAIAEAFASAYRQRYGYDPPAERGIEVESIRAVASSISSWTNPPAVAPTDRVRTHAADPTGSSRARFAGAWCDVATYERGSLAPGARLDGPALVLEARTCLVIEPGWRAESVAEGALDVVRNSGTPRALAASRSAERERPVIVRAELFANRLTSIAREMGELLERTAISTNVRERLDFSCAILDAGGELIVNAPHIPVHLGALGHCVRTVCAQLALSEGDVAVTNHPAFGGSHLPDVTVISPVFCAGALVGYVANRAHHAEIGGTRPGSMPPRAKTLAEEGVLVAPRLLVAAGESREGEIEALLRAPPWPSRAVRDNLADLRAQVAANRLGERALARLAESCGAQETAERMADLTSRAERIGREAIWRLFIEPGTVYDAECALDDGTPLRVRLSFDRRSDRVKIDFTGSGAVHPGSFNATPAIVSSAVMFVMRLLTDQSAMGGILNEGLMRAVEIRLARNSLLDPVFTDDPRTSPAVVAGNVETSQRIVEVLLRAIGLCAGSQGTMNNVLFGDGSFGYYETVCGGCGAGPGFDGASAVHSHMTNTRITDCEVLEHRYPVRLERFAIRAGSGGAGRHRGGDGVVREYRFLAPMALSVVTQHRTEGGFGASDGKPGAAGSQRIIRADGSIQPLGAVDGCDVQPGDRLLLETPGGGGWGPPC